MKAILILLTITASLSVNAQQVEKIYLKDSSTVYRGFIIEQAPAKYVKIFRIPERDTLTVQLVDVWKIEREGLAKRDANGPANTVKEAMSNNELKREIFVELFGASMLYSVNYDTRLVRGRRDGWGVRAGLGVWGASYLTGAGFEKLTVLAFPLGVNYLIGKRKGQLELGIGATLLRISDNFVSGSDVSIGFYDATLNATTTITTLSFVYRHSPIKKQGIIWRVGLEPIIIGGGSLSPFIPLPTVGIGYKF